MSVTVSRPARRRPVFYPLPVIALERLTEDSVCITFGVPLPLRDTFAFRAGQHLTVRRAAPATGRPEAEPSGARRDVRRSYSICSTPAELAVAGRLRIGVKEIPGGAFSAHAVRALRTGDIVDVLPPLGSFTADADPGRTRRYGAIVAGSGITPVLSIAATVLAVEPASTVDLVFGNRTSRDVMFVEDLADLKDRYPARFRVLHALSREPGEVGLLAGRLDADRIDRLLDTLVPAAEIDEWFLCGPYPMVRGARQVLARRAPAAAVHTELFFAEPVDQPAAGGGAGRTAAPAGDRDVTITLDGRASAFRMGGGERVLDAALRVRPELPYACRGGVCATCRAKVVEGEVSMARNFALEPAEVAVGYVLTCQASPVSDRLVLDYDA